MGSWYLAKDLARFRKFQTRFLPTSIIINDFYWLFFFQFIKQTFGFLSGLRGYKNSAIFFILNFRWVNGEKTKKKCNTCLLTIIYCVFQRENRKSTQRLGTPLYLFTCMEGDRRRSKFEQEGFRFNVPGGWFGESFEIKAMIVIVIRVCLRLNLNS